MKAETVVVARFLFSSFLICRPMFARWSQFVWFPEFPPNQPFFGAARHLPIRNCPRHLSHVHHPLNSHSVAQHRFAKHRFWKGASKLLNYGGEGSLPQLQHSVVRKRFFTTFLRPSPFLSKRVRFHPLNHERSFVCQGKSRPGNDCSLI